MIEDMRFNGAVIPHRDNPNTFADQSGDRIWIESVTQLEMVQVWGYEERDGEAEAPTTTCVALDEEQVLKLYNYLGDFLATITEKRMTNG